MNQSLVHVSRESIHQAGACNFCSRGKPAENKGLVYPYTDVFVLNGKQMSMNICEDCGHELMEQMIGEEEEDE